MNTLGLERLFLILWNASTVYCFTYCRRVLHSKEVGPHTNEDCQISEKVQVEEDAVAIDREEHTKWRPK